VISTWDLGLQSKRGSQATLDYSPPKVLMALSRVPGDDELFVGGYVMSRSLKFEDKFHSIS
jgi:hypothetical protein